jgi:hypothetical protein
VSFRTQIATLRSLLLPRKAGGRRRIQPTKYGVSRGVLASTHPEGLVLLNIRDGRVLKGNRTALRIWVGLLQGLSGSEIAAGISQEWNVDATRVEREAAAFITDLLGRGLLGEV